MTQRAGRLTDPNKADFADLDRVEAMLEAAAHHRRRHPPGRRPQTTAL